MKCLPTTVAASLLFFTLLSCGAKQPAVQTEPLQASQMALQENESVPLEAVQPRKLIRTAHLSIEVEDSARVATEAEARTVEAGGYVARRNSYAWNESRGYELELRIPNEKLDVFIAELTAQAVEVRREELQTQDVTASFVDAQARLGALEATEKELLSLLSESRSRGDKAAEIMSVFRELTEIRSRIEQIQGQLNLLQNQTVFATLHLSLSPSRSNSIIGTRWQPIETLRTSLGTLLGGLRLLGDLLIYLIVVALPLALLVAAPIWFVARNLRRRRRSREDG